jgi:hypothetical protein
VRLTAGANSSYLTGAVGGISGNALWAPFRRLALDVGAYWQDGDSGPTARARFQILFQDEHGLDVSAGLRYKSVGFEPRNGEVEFLVSAGRRFGRVGAVLNVLGGTELGGPGIDVEAKALIDVGILERLRLGLDSRAQVEIRDEAGFKSSLSFVDDAAVIAGAFVAWRPLDPLQIQLLAGARKPRGLSAGPTARLLISWDF